MEARVSIISDNYTDSNKKKISVKVISTNNLITYRSRVSAYKKLLPKKVKGI